MGQATTLVRSKKLNKGSDRFPRFEDFNTPLHKQWKRDQALRRTLPLFETFRGCLGLGVTFNDTKPVVHGKSLLYPSDAVTFHAVRDIPPYHFSGIQHRRNVTYASRAKANLHFGSPVLRFDQDLRSAVDLQMMPYDKLVIKPRHADEFKAAPEIVRPEGDVLDSEQRLQDFGLYNRINEEKTLWAFCGVDDRGRSVRPAWDKAKRQLSKMSDQELRGHNLSRADVDWLMGQKPRHAKHPREGLPVPYLRFKLSPHNTLGDLLAQIFWQATESEGRVDVLECPKCHARHDTHSFGLHDSTGITMVSAETTLGLEWIDGEKFLAHAPCGCRGNTKDGRTVWHTEDAKPGRIRRRFTATFKAAFCDAVGQGLPFRMPCDCSYVGVDRTSVIAEGGGELDVEAHRFVSNSNHARNFAIYAGRGMVVNHKVGAKLKAGQVFFSPLELRRGLNSWKQQCLDDRWNTLAEILGGSRWVGFAQLQWFANQAILDGDEVLLPYTLVGTTAKDLRPTGLSWDFGRLTGRMDKDRMLCVLPVLPMGRWDYLRQKLPFDIELDANVFDTRFSAQRREPKFETPLPPKAPPAPEPVAENYQTVELVGDGQDVPDEIPPIDVEADGTASVVEEGVTA